MAKLEALLFDVDGTLADTERDGHRVAFNAAFKQAGLDWYWSEELYGKLLAVTGGKERIRYYLEKFNTGFQHPEDLTGFIADLHKSKTGHYERILNEGEIPLRTGVQRLLEESRTAGMRMAVVTTTTPANVSALLSNSLGADGERWFEVIAAGDIVPHKKPAPDIYNWAMEKMGLVPEQCLALEDSRNGYLSARDADINAIVITVNGYTEEDDFTGAPMVVSHLGEPGNPSQSFDGMVCDEGVVTLDCLKQLHQR